MIRSCSQNLKAAKILLWMKHEDQVATAKNDTWFWLSNTTVISATQLRGLDCIELEAPNMGWNNRFTEG